MTRPDRPLPRGYIGELVSSFTEIEVLIAIGGALSLEFFFLVVLIAMANQGAVKTEVDTAPKPIPIQIKPVIDDLPLLKLGGKKKTRMKLPDMWQKNPPVKRYQAASAPSPHAEDNVKKIPDTPVATRDAEAPPPDAEVAKKVDDLQPDASVPRDAAEPKVEGEGSPDGVKEGTETDPLKARAVSQYRMKILGWFNARFTPPTEGAPCEELKKLRASVVATIGPDRTVTGFSIVRPSGNPVFDAKIQSTMDALRGQELPPPPPLYPDILNSSVNPTFSGANAACQ